MDAAAHKKFPPVFLLFRTTDDGRRTTIYTEAMKSLLANLLAVALAVAATWVDLHVGDLALLLIMAMAFPMLLALVWPRQFWMWAVVVALPLP